jgi:hypothetical protein
MEAEEGLGTGLGDRAGRLGGDGDRGHLANFSPRNYSVFKVDTLWTDFLKNCIFAGCENASD